MYETYLVLDDVQGPWMHELYVVQVLHSTWSAGYCSAAGRVILRRATIAAATATDPYSTIMIQSGTTHGRPTMRRCQT